MNYGVEMAPLGSGRGFRWFDGSAQGEILTTLVAVHVAAMQSGRTHGGVMADRLLGADLWGSYVAACAILDTRPNPTAHNVTMREVCLAAALHTAKGICP